MIKASVIIATYKRPQETAKCLELLAQSQYLGKQFVLEVIVVDSSPDNLTEKSIKKFEKNFELKYLKLLKKTLPGEARNIAIKKSKNELIIILDSDIELKSETIWQMVEYLKNHPQVARMTGKSIFSAANKKGEVDRPAKWDRTLSRDNTIFIEGIYGRYEAFYKSVFLQIGGYDTIFGICGEGTDLSIRCWRAGFPLGISENIIAFHNAEAPESLRRADTDKMVAMYRSLMLVAYKYDVSEPQLGPNFIKSHAGRRDTHGGLAVFPAIISAAKSIEWFYLNYPKILESKKQIPNDFDLRPFNIFTDKKLINLCLNLAEEKINPYYQRVFVKQDKL